jgi:hypothetical protein
MAGIYPETWSKQLVRFFESEKPTWRVGIPDISKDMRMLPGVSEVVAVNITTFTDKVTVLIDNVTYPLPVVELAPGNIVALAKKYQTPQTPATHDVMMAGVNLKLIDEIIKTHTSSTAETMHNFALHSLAPASNATKTPVIVTTGEVVGTRRRFLPADLDTLGKAWDDLGIPAAGRRFVPCSDHKYDWYAADKTFKDYYHNVTSGEIYNYHGWEIHMHPSSPQYHAGTLAKLSFGGVVTSNHRTASVAFSTQRSIQGMGNESNKLAQYYISKAENDPAYQRNMMNMRQYDLVMPVNGEAHSAIVSAIAP